MMQHLRRTFCQLFNVKDIEVQALLLLCCHAFFKQFSAIYLETSANTLFLSRFDVGTLPYVYLTVAVASIGVGIAFNKLDGMFPVLPLLKGTLIFIAISLGLFWFTMVTTDNSVFYFLVKAWVEVVYLLTEIEVWVVAGLLFNIRQGKRLFGLVAASDTMASILGGFTIPVIMRFVGAEFLLLVSAAGAVVSLGYLWRIGMVFKEKFEDDSEEEEEESKSLKDYWKDSYLKMFFIMASISMCAFYFVDYIFYSVVEEHYTDEAKLAAFFGLFFGMAGVAKLISSMFLSARLMNRFGVVCGLMAPVVVVLLGSGTASLTQFFTVTPIVLLVILAATKLLHEATMESLQMPGYRLLYQPFPKNRRLRVQNIIESIIEPAAAGVTGLILLLLGSVIGLGIQGMITITLVLTPLWLVTCFLMKREYPKKLETTLKRRRFDGDEISLDDAETEQALMEIIRSDNPMGVIYASQLLEESKSDKLPQALTSMLSYPDDLVKIHALKRIDALNITSSLNDIKKLLRSEPAVDVLGQALVTCAAIEEDITLEEIEPYLRSDLPPAQLGSLLALLRSGGIDGILLAGELLKKKQESSDPNERKFAARVLGEVGIPSFYRSLFPLLQDAEYAVRKEALCAAGKLQNKRLLPEVLKLLPNPMHREDVTNALEPFGEGIFTELMELYNEPECSTYVQLQIIRVIGRIGGDQACQLLTTLLDSDRRDIRRQVLDRLARLRFQSKDTQKIHAYLDREITEATWMLAAQKDLAGHVDDLVIQSIEEELSHHRDHIFQLLSFISNSESMKLLSSAMKSSDQDLRANAIEMLDAIISKELGPKILPLIDDSANAEEKLKLLSLHFDVESLTVTERLSQLMLRNDSHSLAWTRACAVYQAQLHHTDELTESIQSSSRDPREIVRETASFSLKKNKPNH